MSGHEINLKEKFSVLLKGISKNLMLYALLRVEKEMSDCKSKDKNTQRGKTHRRCWKTCEKRDILGINYTHLLVYNGFCMSQCSSLASAVQICNNKSLPR